MKPNPNWSLTLTALLVTGAWSLSVADQDSPQAKWVDTGNLNTGRTYNTATLLANGQVLIVGGHGRSADTGSTELYKPDQGVFVPSTDIGVGRANHTATLLRNGQVLVVGGLSNGKILADADLYNPATATWTPTGSLHLARACHAATLLSNGQVMVTGGTHLPFPPVFVQGAPPGSAVDITEIYDPASGKWTVTDNLHIARYAHTATLLKNGQVLVTGGIGSNGIGAGGMTSAELYNPSTGTWTVTASLNNGRFGQAATVLSDGKVLVTGGNLRETPLHSTELYDPSHGTWTATGDLHSANGPAILLPNGQVLVAGGGGGSGVLPDAEIYDPFTGVWSMTARMHTPRMLQTSTVLPNGKVLVEAGNDGTGTPSGVIENAELYSSAPESAPKPQSAELATVSPVQPESQLPPIVSEAAYLVTFTICMVILTACVVVLLASWLVFVLVRRWRK